MESPIPFVENPARRHRRFTLIATVLLCLGSALAPAGCARYAHGSSRVALGMNRAEVRRACGIPYSTSTTHNAEHWFYHDAHWEDAPTNWQREDYFTHIIFIGGRVTEFGPYRVPRPITPSPATPSPAGTPLRETPPGPPPPSDLK
jgi:hypothetical protein